MDGVIAAAIEQTPLQGPERSAGTQSCAARDATRCQSCRGQGCAHGTCMRVDGVGEGRGQGDERAVELRQGRPFYHKLSNSKSTAGRGETAIQRQVVCVQTLKTKRARTSLPCPDPTVGPGSTPSTGSAPVPEKWQRDSSCVPCNATMHMKPTTSTHTTRTQHAQNTHTHKTQNAKQACAHKHCWSRTLHHG